MRGAAELGLAVEAAGSALAAKSVDEAVERYQRAGARVDRAHRQLEQLRHALLYSQLDHFEELRPLLDGMRELWRTWADGWARDFNQLCRERGFLPSAALRQRGIFEEVVRPLASKGTTAYFVVDALRYEMGEALCAAMAGAHTDAKLSARLAELPTNTEVGMNVLAPVADERGRLKPAVRDGRIAGFSTGELRVSNPETRKRAMQDRIGGKGARAARQGIAACPWLTLAEVLDRGAASLKATVSKANLVVVHSEELDKAGENDFGPKVFDQVLGHVRTAWRLLREAGVKNFVISADHGFLLLHDRVENAKRHGRKIDPNRRHVLTKSPSDETGVVRVALADLGYEGVDDLHLIVPETTAAFDTGKRGGDFVHGGNSLEERVIPVLTVTHRAAAGGSSLSYRVDARPKEGLAGMHCLALRVQVAAQSALSFARDDEVELALRVTDLPDVDVDLVQARGGGRIAGGTVYAPVGKELEIFFRLHGLTDARAQVEIFHPGAAVDVESCVVARRFDVAATGTKPEPEEEQAEKAEPALLPEVARGWLEELPEGGVRQLFAHLSDHGTVSEAEASRMLGGARRLRRFSAKFEDYAAVLPFSVRIESIAGVKTYVKEGGGR